jgi:hypothetical protein
MMSVVRLPPTGVKKQRRSPDRGKATGATGASSGNADAPYKRKLIAFDAETWHALHLLARDSMKSLQEIADEAFADVLKKHHRPTDLKEALRESVRRAPANDPRPMKPAGDAAPRRPPRSGKLRRS